MVMTSNRQRTFRVSIDDHDSVILNLLYKEEISIVATISKSQDTRLEDKLFDCVQEN